MTNAVEQESIKVIVFQLADKEYAIPVSHVQGIEKLMHITRVPKTAKYVKGVINLRGVVTPIVDLRERFELPISEHEETTRIIITSLEDMEVGFVVDSANDVIDIPASAIEPQPEVVGSLEEEFISGVAKVEKRLLILLHLEKVLNSLKERSIMAFNQKITSLHLDVLKEIGNIGAAHAATALSNLLGKKIDMRVPKVEMVSFNDMMELAGGSENVVVGIYLRIEGDAEGSMFFILPIEQANRFIRRLIFDDSFDFKKRPVSELGLSAMQEMGNILSGSYLSALSDFTNLKIYPTVPGLSVDMFGAIISIGLIELSHVSDNVIVINTSIFEEGVEDHETVRGHFFLLPDPDSFDAIFKALGVS